ncbi:MAG: helix-turn-helix transcriptional regulator [Oscillospiraceae bacterium]|nr:helix-turn-helix transcriptional regulator [Oscillospiraceae bacterium]
MIIIINRAIFSHQLQKLRKKYYLSQKALAALIGVSVYSLRGWESGTLEPLLHPQTLRRLCQVLDTTPEQLSGEDISTEV